MFFTSKYSFGSLFLFAIPFLCLLNACGVSKNLKTDETLLRKNTIVLQSDKRIKGKRALKYELSTILKQQPNERFLRLFKTRLWAYYRMQKKLQTSGDTSKWDKWVTRVIAEPPSLYNKQRSEATAQSMQYYLQHKGYNDAIVKDTAIHDYKRKKTYITYTAQLNNLYKIDTVFFLSKDSAVHQLMLAHQKESYLKKGKAVSKSVFDDENNRFISLLQNNGYAFFNNSYFYAEGDTSQYKVTVHYEILTPPRSEQHTVYKVGTITVIPDYSPNTSTPALDTMIAGISFLKRQAELKVKAKNIVSKIFLKTGALYKEDDYIKTNLQLGNLDIFRKVNIQHVINPEHPDVLDFVIQLTPRKRMVFGADLELNNSTFNSSRTSLLGVAGSINFRHRNLFRNAYLFLAEIQGGVDLNWRNTENLLYSLDLTAQGNLYMPRFVDPIHAWRGLKNIRLLNKGFYQDLKEKGRTRLSASYNNLSLFQFYSYNSFNFSYGYDLQRNTNNRYEVNQLGINYLLTDIQPAFQEVLDSNTFLANSFDDQLFTGLIFKDFTYTFVSKTNNFGESFFFQGNVELSGLEMSGINAIYNTINNSQDTFKLFDQVEFAQFASIQLDGRYYRSISSSQSFAARVTAGLARPFGFTDEVPYVKQFYAGGPNSIRAWRIRELGPGQYYDEASIPTDNTPFYQTADFKFELSAEYRFDIFWMFESAFFIDAGNIWTIQEDPNRVGAPVIMECKIQRRRGFNRQEFSRSNGNRDWFWSSRRFSLTLSYDWI